LSCDEGFQFVRRFQNFFEVIHVGPVSFAAR
jgi:hypothetical protein